MSDIGKIELALWQLKSNPRQFHLEEIISKNSYYSYMYARDIIKERFVLAEKNISKDPSWSYSYATGILKCRFIEAENRISESPYWSYLYAKDVIKGRFIEGEESISDNEENYSNYKNMIL
jgi:hypothetical protein